MTDFSHEPAHAGHAELPLGQRLQRARAAKQLSLAAAAAELKVPVAVLEALERDDHGRLGAPIYVRGHLRSYAQLLGLPPILAETAARHVEMPALRSAQRVSHLRYLADRYALRAVYLLLTAAIFVPVLWVATQRPQFDPASAVRSLDTPPPLPTPAPASTSEAATAASPAAAEGATPAPGVPAPGSSEVEGSSAEGEDFPMMASLTPFYPSRAAEPAPPAAATSDALAADGWVFRFRADSWVEVVAVDGRRLEYGLVRAGSQRLFADGQIARVALGNADGVEVLRKGQSLSLDAFRRANVARFAVSSTGDLLPIGG